MLDLANLLKGNPYPGRGVLIGNSPDGKHGVIAYFIMGRSENSRNRVFLPTEDGIRTEAYDPAKLKDPSLIIYHPLRRMQFPEGTVTIVTNGDQTDTIRDYLADGKTWNEALDSRCFEPDAPNFTPRISGVLGPKGNYGISILKSMEGNPDCCLRGYFGYDHPVAGVGHLIHTYEGDGNPLPSFKGEPRPVALPDTVEQLSRMIWDNLNPDNRVSLFTSYIDLETGKADCRVVNQRQDPDTYNEI